MSGEDYESDLRDGQRALLHALYPEDYTKLKEAAKRLGIPFERARQAYQYGKGSTITINGLLLFGLGVHPKDMKRYVPQVREAMRKPTEPSTLNSLIEEARSLYGENDLIAWLRLLIAKHDIETELKMNKKRSGKPAKKNKS